MAKVKSTGHFIPSLRWHKWSLMAHAHCHFRLHPLSSSIFVALILALCSDCMVTMGIFTLCVVQERHHPWSTRPAA